MEIQTKPQFCIWEYEKIDENFILWKTSCGINTKFPLHIMKQYPTPEEYKFCIVCKKPTKNKEGDR